MWLITDTGFYSIVHKPSDPPAQLTVRARVASDLDNLRTFVPELSETIEHAGTDYPYRATCTRQALAPGMARMAQAVHYNNVSRKPSVDRGMRRMVVRIAEAKGDFAYSRQL